MVNPRLGSLFGIFASALAALVIVGIVVEELGVADPTLRWLLLAGPVTLSLAYAVVAPTSHALDYFAAGRRVPAVYTGLVLAVTALGATGMVTITGAIFFLGFDAFPFMIGGLAGFVVMAVLLAPFVRKFGAYTLPTYLGRRFESRALRLVAAALLSIPMLLVVAAELTIGARLAAWLTGAPAPILVAALTGCVLLAAWPGGLRSLSWSGTAQAIAVMLAILVPAAIVAVIETKIPLPQLSFGPLVRSMVRAEAVHAIPELLAPPLALDLPGQGFDAIAKRFVTPFGAVGPAAFVILTLTVMAGTAASPWLLPRVCATPGVYEARKSLGWATLFFGVLFLTLTSIAAFLREPYIALIADREIVTALPEWLLRLQDAGVAQARAAAGMTRLAVGSVSFDRDLVIVGLPIAHALPATLIYLAAAAIVVGALAAAGAAAGALANVLAEDAVGGLAWQPPADGPRLLLARTMLLVALVGAAALALLAPTDPLQLLVWALTITAATAFPVLVLSIWWKRLNAFGALAGMATGFLLSVAAILAGTTGALPVAGPVAAAVALPLGTLIAMLVAVATPPPSRHALELVRDIRVPGGEILYDREMQRLRLKQRKRPG